MRMALASWISATTTLMLPLCAPKPAPENTRKFSTKTRMVPHGYHETML